jgi:hypothetical protein
VSERDGAAALGAPELAGSFVNPRGLTRKFAPASPGQVTDVPSEGAPEIPRFGRVGYLSVTDDEIAIVRTRRGAFSMKITDQVLARVPRSAIARVEFDGGALLSHLTISFDNATVWAFDIPMVNRRSAARVAGALGA